jgi:hypothetical protein
MSVGGLPLNLLSFIFDPQSPYLNLKNSAYITGMKTKVSSVANISPKMMATTIGSNPQLAHRQEKKLIKTAINDIRRFNGHLNPFQTV